MPLDDCHLLLGCDPTFSFDMIYDEYIDIFNKLMSATSYAFNYFKKRAPRSFINSYMFKRGGVFGTLGICILKWTINYSHLYQWIQT